MYLLYRYIQYTVMYKIRFIFYFISYAFYWSAVWYFTTFDSGIFDIYIGLKLVIRSDLRPLSQRIRGYPG